MLKINKGRTSRPRSLPSFRAYIGVLFVTLVSLVFLASAGTSSAQVYRFTSVQIEGNQRVEPGTILSYAGIARGETVSAGQLNEAYQRILASGLFETVEIIPQGNLLVIKVTEYPTINRVSIEGNKRLKDEELLGFIESKSRQVFSPTRAERDAAVITEAYAQNGRLAARVTPKIIRRSDNRVDLVFEVFEGGNVEVQRIGFVGNRAYSDRRLRRVLESKQAGLLRVFVKSDTFVEDRIEFDKQVLQDFYQSRGYVDFRTLSVNAELARERDAYFVTFNVQEGQQFRFGEITTVSEMDGADAEEFQDILKIRPGIVYSPTQVENSIARMERLAVRKGLDFLRVEPRITRNDRDLTLDVEFALTKGPRIFVERIDIEGNTTTLDRVIRQQFDTVEGDPFNPRAIRESAERIRALGFFRTSEVNAREGSRPDQVLVDVNVEEAPTGSVGFGGSYSTDSGFGLNANFSERNFLGRGQALSFSVGTTDSATQGGLRFVEPAFLGRDVAFDFALEYGETDANVIPFDTAIGTFSTGLTFPISDNGRLRLHYAAEMNEMSNYEGAIVQPAPPAAPVGIIANEIALGDRYVSSVGYRYTYDTRRTGLNPNAGVLLEFGQDFAGLGGDLEYIKSTGRVVAQTLVLNEEVTLRASLEGGALHFANGSTSRYVNRFSNGSGIMRGFENDGIGPREFNLAGTDSDVLGSEYYAIAKFEADFPLGLPEEYGIRGGVFYDIGAFWGIDKTNAVGAITSAGFEDRHVLGVSLLLDTAIGPLRFNWSQPIKKSKGDIEQNFELTISTQF